MRVISGDAKGYRLKVPRAIRPTTGQVRGAIFSVLHSLSQDWPRVLDLYAGTGALGIEALSRGARWADFVDRERRCCELIKSNLELTGLSSQAHVYCAAVTKALTFLKDSYDLIFLDPPYSVPSLETIVAEIATSAVMGRGSTLVVCHSSLLSLSASYDGLRLITERRYGDTTTSLFRREA